MLKKPGLSTLQSRVDFAYSFGTPHRLTAALPESSHKTLLDLKPGCVHMRWTYDDLTDKPLNSYYPTVMIRNKGWGIELRPELNNQPFAHSEWTRSEGYLPILDNSYTDARGRMRLEIAGGKSAAIVRIEMANTGDRLHRFSVLCVPPASSLGGYNPGWRDFANPCDSFVAGGFDWADRVLIMGIGADEFSCGSEKPPEGTKPADYPALTWGLMKMSWDLAPGETASGWIIRPYEAYIADLPDLRSRNWAEEMEYAKQVWRELVGRGVRVEIPDSGVKQSFYACLADLFVMRERVKDGYIAGICGTEIYRASNSCEPLMASIALDQVGLHKEAEIGQRMPLDLQEKDGNWIEPKSWGGGTGWSGSGWKSWVIMEHYRLTGDIKYLKEMYPRMRASSRWQESMRARTRVMENNAYPLTYGLMPRGNGDCGLMDDNMSYGVFFPHNFWPVFADRLTVEAAEILGMEDDLPELREIYNKAYQDLMRSLEKGVINENGYRWIPGCPGKTSGSSWGALNAAVPCGLIPPDHELIRGTIRKMESNLSPGGLPMHTGFMEDGIWVAIDLDHLAQTHLARGNGDAFIEYLYATLNHGTPLYTWCEERGKEAGTTQISGDRQHLWTPLAVVRAVRDCLITEEGRGLHLARGTAREWLASGGVIGISNAPTHFGSVSFQMKYEASENRAKGKVVFPDQASMEYAALHIRLPNALLVKSVDSKSEVTVLPDGAGIMWQKPSGEIEFEAKIG